MNQNETIRILSIFRAIWPETTVTDHVITGWQWAFEDVPYRLVESGAKRYIRAGKPFFPKPSDILELIGMQEVAPDLVPEAAWAEVQREILRCGHNRPRIFHNGDWSDPPQRQFSSPLIAEAVDAIGWVDLCRNEKPEILRAQFAKTLTALVNRAVKRVQAGDEPATALPDQTGTLRELPRKAVS